MKRLDKYAEFTGEAQIRELYDLASGLENKSMVHINSTYYGGGVAEMLNSYVPLLNEAGLPTEWRLLKGGREFFTVTKKMHDALQGMKTAFTKKDYETYETNLDNNAEFIKLNWYDLVVIDDPQPCGLITRYSRQSPSFWKPMPIFLKSLNVQKKQPWAWRAHIDLSNPDRKIWAYLARYLQKYDGIILSSKKYSMPVKKPHYFIPPAIDPLSDKNRHMDESEIHRQLEKHDINESKPLVLQVSRFDKWKDPLGVIRAFKKARSKTGCQLVLIGSMASDDPEGEKIFNEVFREVEKNDDIRLITEQNDLLVNALQRRAAVVVQKSLREGFGLTVSEALWKGTPVVATRVGGIPLQVDDGVNGYLVRGVDDCADRIHFLLTHPAKARELGRNGIQKVRKNFLITRLVKDELELFRRMTASTTEKLLYEQRRKLSSGLELMKKFLPLFS